MSVHVRINEASGTFELYDTATGLPVEPDAPAARPFSGKTRSELTALSRSELAFADSAPLPAVVAPVQRRAALLTAAEHQICEAMGITPDEFLATRAAQPHPWASPVYLPGVK